MPQRADNFLDKRKKVIRPLNLYMQLPDENFAEVVKDYNACFFDISKKN
jgi:hypothetical protein